MESNSLDTFRLHKKHLLRVLGLRTDVRGLGTSELQGYANRRAKEKYRGAFIKSRTIKKEIATLRAVWNWGRLHKHVAAESPTRGLQYAKEDERIPFLPWEEIERRLARGGLNSGEIAELWEALFLSRERVNECLEQVKRSAPAPAFVYPMFVFVAHTGARRSEMMRSRVDDFDFEARRVTIREKKRDRNKKETRRHVDMTPLLERVMRDWLGRHPGGQFTFTYPDLLARSRKRSMTTGHQSGPNRAKTLRGRSETVRKRTDRPGPEMLTKNEANYHFKAALSGGKWEVLRGFHVFRHSFASNLAAAGVRPDVIDSLMGHQTEGMRKRYRHLFPHETRDAVSKVFGE